MQTQLSTTYRDVIVLERPENNLRGAICFFRLPSSCQFEEIVDVLHPQELEYYKSLKFDRRKRSYLLGRYVAKQAIGFFVPENDPRSILIQPGIFNQPCIVCPDMPNMQVSITHCDEAAAAIAFPESHPMGIDIERIDNINREVIESQCTEKEKKLIDMSFDRETVQFCRLWTVKEALSKVLKTGLTTPFPVFEIERTVSKPDTVVSHFTNFGQYKAYSFVLGTCVCSIACPKKTDLALDIRTIKKIFER